MGVLGPAPSSGAPAGPPGTPLSRTPRTAAFAVPCRLLIFFTGLSLAGPRSVAVSTPNRAAEGVSKAGLRETDKIQTGGRPHARAIKSAVQVGGMGEVHNVLRPDGDSGCVIASWLSR